eukprot:12278530-Alexandrium_andersonii.AAC.1
MQMARRQGRKGEERLKDAAAVTARVASLRKEALASRTAKRQEGGGGPSKVGENSASGTGASGP